MNRELKSGEQTDAIVRALLHAPMDALGGLSILQAVDSGKWGIYIGLTSRSLEEEALRFLSQRGANHAEDYDGPITVNRPVLQLKDPRPLPGAAGAAGRTTRVVTEKQAMDLGFRSQVIHVDRLRFNASAVEDGLQLGINHAPLGQRLHRHVAKGRNIDDMVRWGVDSVTSVFITYVRLDAVLGPNRTEGELYIVP